MYIYYFLQVIEQTHSRIPVYDGSPDNIVALLLVKTLIKLDPDDCTPVRRLVESGDARPVIFTTSDKPLFDLLNEFQEGRGKNLVRIPGHFVCGTHV